MANKRKAGVTDGELAKRLADHLINGGENKDQAWERATAYYNSHHCFCSRKSQEELEKEQKVKDQKEFLRQMEEAKAGKAAKDQTYQTFEVAAEGEEHVFVKA